MERPDIATPHPSRVSPLAPLAGRVISGSALLVVPGLDWNVSGDRWQIQDEATLLCLVSGPVEPVTFELESDSALPPLDVRWDEADLPPGSVVEKEQSLRVEVAPWMLAKGSHELSFRLKNASGRLSITSLRFRSGGRDESFEPSRRASLGYLSSLLGQGVTGVDTLDQLGGFAFVGTQSIAIPMEGGSSFSTTLENGSWYPSRFVIEGGGAQKIVELEPLARRSVSFDLPAGGDSIRLTASGAPTGKYLWGAPAIRQARGPKQPPIVLITLDTTRKDVLAPYGGAATLTPNLAAFAEGATVFDDAYSTSPWTLPSHASIFTGLYPVRHGAGVSSARLVSPHETLAERLRDAGYDTAGFPGGLLCRTASGLAQGFLTYREPETGDVPDAKLTGLALARVSGSNGAPLFLFVNYFGPHFPYTASDEARVRAGATKTPGARTRSRSFDLVLAGDGAAWTAAIDGELGATGADIEALRRAYEAGVADTDTELGLLLDGLRERGLYDEALIVIVADHGELLGEGGHFSHTSRLDDELVSVPLFVKWPGQKRGARVGELVSIVDLFPTILRAAGVRPPASDGIELSGSEDDELAKRSAVMMEEHDRPSHVLFKGMKIADDVVRLQARDGWMLVTSRKEQCHVRSWLGFREVDCDSEAAAAIPRLPELVQLALTGGRTGRAELSEEQIRNLRALGYIR